MKWKLAWPILLTLVLPLIVAWFVYPNHLPPGFGQFPPQFKGDAPGFNLAYFIFVLLAVLAISVFILFPTWFGFKSAQSSPAKPSNKHFPWWFWAGMLCMLFFWWLMWARETPFGSLVYWAFTPLWWGFIFTLDGLVYKRNHGKSLFSSRPITLLITGLVSILGWAYFEFYDYFVLGNWYYPNAQVAQWGQTLLSLEFLLTYSTVTPVLFQWYNLLSTFPKLKARYENGPKLPISGNFLLWLGFATIALMTVFPYPLFWSVWIGPLAVLSGVLIKLKVWNPIASIGTGNWSPAILIALSSFATGFFWEFWNHGSNVLPGPATNPNFWVYNIPYVNVLHFFSEMPLLGYWGYLPFGIFVWQFFLWTGKFFGFSTDIDVVSES